MSSAWRRPKLVSKSTRSNASVTVGWAEGLSRVWGATEASLIVDDSRDSSRIGVTDSDRARIEGGGDKDGDLSSENSLSNMSGALERLKEKESEMLAELEEVEIEEGAGGGGGAIEGSRDCEARDR